VNVSQGHREAYVDCLLKEMEPYRGTRIDTVYLGGGTPSILQVASLRVLIERLYQTFVVAPEAEFTVEVNPEHARLPLLKALRALGVNRISLGAQTFHDAHLKALGRQHDARDIARAFGAIRQAGFDNINLDLLYGVALGGTDSLQGDLRALLDLDCEHISAYALTIEKNSLFYVRRVPLPSIEQQRTQFLRVKDHLRAHGYDPYEVSNFAKPGYASRHNRNYWAGGNYGGLGMAAHSHWNGRRSWNVATLFAYMERVASGRSPMDGEETLLPEQRLIETFLLGLRMREGVFVKGLEERFGCLFPPEKYRVVRALINEGYLLDNGQRIRTTAKGALVLDEICSRII
jgi:oxygen-independent coproporphyrinogen-3 oxidase